MLRRRRWSLFPLLLNLRQSQPAPVPAREPRYSGGNRYNLYAKVNGIWVWQFAVDAASHGEGLSQAVARLTSAIDGSPIRLEQDDSLSNL